MLFTRMIYKASEQAKLDGKDDDYGPWMMSSSDYLMYELSYLYDEFSNMYGEIELLYSHIDESIANAITNTLNTEV
jgi:hypothetical protein